MDPEDVEFCNGVVDELLKRPCAKPFIKPIPTDDEDYSGYYVKIKKPMYFSKVQEKLLTGSYKSINEWEKDINSIFTNTDRFFGKDSCMSYMANEVRKHFDKLMNEGIPDKPRDWVAEVNELQRKIDEVIKSTPPELSKFWKHEIKIKALPQMKNDEIRDLVNASKLLTGKEDARAMFSLIHQMNPEINAFSEDVTLDLDTLSNKTHYALQWYIQKRLDEDGVQYPHSKSK